LMEKTGQRITENYKWTAFMKLKGQTCARREEEILNEFDGFVQSLRGVGVDYNIIVMVEGGVPRQLHSDCNARETEAGMVGEGSGA
jgi:hypothetical protein